MTVSRLSRGVIMKMKKLKKILENRLAETVFREKKLSPGTAKSYYNGRRSAFQLILDEIELAEKTEKEGE